METDQHPKIYRMKLWATNEVRAKSKFWKLKKVLDEIRVDVASQRASKGRIAGKKTEDANSGLLEIHNHGFEMLFSFSAIVQHAPCLPFGFSILKAGLNKSVLLSVYASSTIRDSHTDGSYEASATTDASYEFVVTTTQHSIRDANNPARGDLDRVPFKGYGNYCRLGPDAWDEDAKASVKLVLLDEADAMTKDAQFALRRVIEKYTKSTRFALICNHVNKIIPALQSRCTRFQFAPLDAINVSEQLKHVIQAERLDVPECGLKALVRLSNGDMRKALNILQIGEIISGSSFYCSQHLELQDILLGIINQLGPDNLDNLRKLAEQFQKQAPGAGAGADATAVQEDDDDQVPDLVAGETFEAAAEERKSY
ncbi:unnamed protein product [Camellia sinensis]